MPIFVHRFFTYTPSKPRHPLLRLLLGLLGLVVLAGLVVVGLFVGLGMLMFAAVRRMLRKPSPVAPTAAQGNVIDAQYTVVEQYTVMDKGANLGLR
jgi:hypothetical protein